MPETLHPRALCTLEDLKEYLGLVTTDVEHDNLLTRCVNSQSRLIHRYLRGRELVAKNAVRSQGVVSVASQTRTFDIEHDHLDWADDDNYRVFPIGDLSAAPTAVRVKDADGVLQQTLTAAQYVVLPRTSDRADDEPVRELWLRVDVSDPAVLRAGWVLEVDGVWGFPKIPEDVRQWAVVQAGLPFARDVAKYSLTFNLDTNRVEMPKELLDAVRRGLKHLRTPGVA